VRGRVETPPTELGSIYRKDVTPPNSSGGALVLFFSGADSKVDFRKSAGQTIRIRIESENKWTGQPAIMGKGVISVGLFRQDNPDLDQLKSTKYKQLSNVVNQEVELK
jgi:hypothetical protein